MEPLLRQVKQQLDAWPEWTDSKRIVLAISGGVDSMVLLHVMCKLVALQEYKSKELVVAHFNHQLRSKEAHRAEYELVKQVAAQEELLYFGGVWENPTETNVEANARDARYQFFANVLRGSEADTLMTAHHLNDTVETFMMRLMRGTSMKGSQGIPSNYRRILVDQSRHAVVTQVMRPFITIPKVALYEYAAEQQVLYLEDVTNDNHKFLRNRVRHQIIPLFERENPQFLNNVLSLQEQLQASYLAHYQDYLAIEPQLLMYNNKGQDWILYIPAFLDLEEAKLMIYLTVFFEERLVDHIQQYSKEIIEQVASMMHNPSEPNARLMIGGGWQAERQYDYLYIKAIEDQSSAATTDTMRVLEENQWVDLNDQERIGLFKKSATMDAMLEASTASLAVDLSQSETDFHVRHRQDGDVMELSNAGQGIYHKKIARIMIDDKVPLMQRDQMWLVCNQEDQIIWLVNHKQSRLYHPAQSDKITHMFLYQKSK